MEGESGIFSKSIPFGIHKINSLRNPKEGKIQWIYLYNKVIQAIAE